jgi:hypothetical protein
MRVSGRRATLVLASILVVAGAPDAPARAGDPDWELRVGHSYSSVSALAQPATFVWSADLDRPTLTKLDMGLLIDGPWDEDGGFGFGVRASAGSARPRPQRIYSSLLRAWRLFEPMVVSGQGEYEADGGFDVQKGVVGVETTPLGGMPGLGVWVDPDFRLRWRPWVGIGYGNVFTTDEGSDGLEAGGFWRGMARLELHYVPGRAVRGDDVRDRDEAEFDVEATGWLLFDSGRGEGFVKAALTIPLGSGLSFATSAEAGREPPRFELTRRIGIGLGFVY